jgi:hypothetical protein
MKESHMAIDNRPPHLERGVGRRYAHLVARIGVLLLLLFASGCNFDATNGVPSVYAAERERADNAPQLDARHLTARGIPDDFLFAPDFVWFHADRTDVPWGASRIDDPDNIRGF